MMMSNRISWRVAVALMGLWLPLPVLADQIQMKNGDVLNGSVLSLSSNVLVLKNENLGVVNLQRSKVAAIHFGDGAATGSIPITTATNHPSAGSLAIPRTGADADVVALLRGIRADSNLVQQVQTQILSGTSPEATAKFNELLDGLSTGKIDMNGLRAEAGNAADQLRAFKKELGPDAGDEMDGYLGILEAFLRETAPENATTNSAPTAKSKTGQAKP